uniref:Solute carrier organic anion transporter family member n=1 Tax=Rhabditophanes sp. KR3021 TaxID=114890 RepID=A0AC35UHE6_9BILA
MKEQYLIWCFIGVFLTVYFVEAIAGFYMTTNIVNLERQFQIPSKISGLMVSASDFGYIPTVIFISFIGSKSNRAKFIGGGCMLIAIANIMIGYSHFLFPTPTASMTSFRVESILERDLNRWSNDSVTVQDFLTYLKNYNGGVGIGNLNSIMGKNPLQILNQGSQQQIIALSNTTKIGFVKSIDVSQEKNELLRMFKSTFFYCNSPTSQDDQLCISYFAFLREYNNVDPIELSEYRQLIHSSYAYCDMGLNQMKNISHDLKCAENTSSMQPTILIFAGLIILGIGRTVPFSLGLPLVDDNIAKRNLSTFYAFMFIIRILGPSLAFAIGSIVNTKYYIDDVPPGMTVRDPNWIGAWYIGFFLIGCGLFVPSLIMFLFPSGSSDKTDGNEVEMETFVDGKKVKPKSKPKLHLVDKHLKKNKKGVVKPPMTISSTIREFTSAMGECFKKPVFVAITIGKTIDVFAFKGFFLFLNKYLDVMVYIYGKDIQLAVGLEDDVADSDDEEENIKELDPKVDLTISDTKKAIDL